MPRYLSRREFLKLGALALSGLAFNSFPPPADEHSYPGNVIGRVTRDSSIFRQPSWPEGETVGYLHPNDLVNLYYELTPLSGPPYNPKWYRIWGGYLHSAYVQRVQFRYNQPVDKIPESGQICEVTVPYTYRFQFNKFYGWQQMDAHKYDPLYYQSTHWAIGVDEGPDKTPWYRILDELTDEEYFLPAVHMRIIPDNEISPLSPDIPPEEKRIEISVQDQTLVAYERDQVVFQTHVSSGQNRQPDPDGLPWDTPRGRFNIMSKMPSKHMGDGNLASEGYDLPGVPWTCFFTSEGHALHGTYWHDNFGIQMSHGCVNLRTEDAKWLFRWTTPEFKVPVKTHSDWEKRGYGTLLVII
jgi:lipoprotein-anchoring transpeptidase ErfK/SrfK